MMVRFLHFCRYLVWKYQAVTGRVTVFKPSRLSYRELAASCDTYAAATVIETSKTQRPQTAIDTRNMRLLAALTLVLPHGRLTVLDVGGGNGSAFYLARDILGPVFDRWTVVDLPELVRVMPDHGPLVFTASLPIDDGQFHLSWISGTLQYLPDPINMLQDIARLKPEFLCINKTPFSDKPTRLLRKVSPKVPGNSHRLSYPYWLLNEAEIRQTIERCGYTLLTAYDAPEDMQWFQGHGFLVYRGLWFKRHSLQ